MKIQARRALAPFLGVIAAALLVLPSYSFDVGQKLYPKRADLTVNASMDSSSAAVGTLEFGKSYPVKTVSGNFVELDLGGGKTGWVYSGKMIETKPAGENKTKIGGASETSVASAGRALKAETIAYAQRQGLGSAAQQLSWLVNFNKSVTGAQVKAYLQENKLGEYQ